MTTTLMYSVCSLKVSSSVTFDDVYTRCQDVDGCQSRWSLYWPLALFADHFNSETRIAMMWMVCILMLYFNMSNHLTSVFLTSSSQFSIFHTLEKIETRYYRLNKCTFMNLSSLPVTISPSAGRKTIASTEPSCQRRARRYLRGMFKIRNSNV